MYVPVLFLNIVWRTSPFNPIVKYNQQIAWSSGRVIHGNEALLRFAHDFRSSYGYSVYAIKIIKLSTTEYEEKLYCQEPILTTSGTGWNKYGMHHISALVTNGNS